MWKRIRKGGLKTSTGFLFELTGGDLALDFTNTVDNRPTADRKELLTSYKQLLSWAQQSKTLTRIQMAQLAKKASLNQQKAEKARRKAIQLREFLFDLFKCAADGKRLPETVLKKMKNLSQQAIQRYELAQCKTGFQWTPYFREKDFDSIYWRVTHSAVNLLCSERVKRIRRCAGDRCDWLFLDSSKRGNRRWCDMSVCGNRAKARRHYELIKTNRKKKR